MDQGAREDILRGYWINGARMCQQVDQLLDGYVKMVVLVMAMMMMMIIIIIFIILQILCIHSSVFSLHCIFVKYCTFTCTAKKSCKFQVEKL
jgi:hypothetical protein